MTMTFDFPYHLFDTAYPASSTIMKFGNSYDFAAAPTAPDQRVFTLTFMGMKRYVNTDGSLDLTTNANINNVNALEAFYNAVKQSTPFIYPSPVYGDLTVRFKDPLKIPKGFPGGGGVVETLEVILIEQP